MKTGLALLTFAFAAACAPQKDAGITVIAREMAFEPGEIHAARGKSIRVALENRGTVLHDWNVSGLKADGPAPSPHAAHSGHLDHAHPASQPPAAIHAMAEPGRTASLEFKPLEAGTYEYYCSVPGHREAGMRGILIVH